MQYDKIESYRGSFVNNLFHGQGTYTFQDGSYFTGIWHRGKMTNDGKTFTKDHKKMKLATCKYYEGGKVYLQKFSNNNKILGKRRQRIK